MTHILHNDATTTKNVCRTTRRRRWRIFRGLRAATGWAGGRSDRQAGKRVNGRTGKRSTGRKGGSADVRADRQTGGRADDINNVNNAAPMEGRMRGRADEMPVQFKGGRAGGRADGRADKRSCGRAVGRGGGLTDTKHSPRSAAAPD